MMRRWLYTLGYYLLCEWPRHEWPPEHDRSLPPGFEADPEAAFVLYIGGGGSPWAKPRGIRGLRAHGLATHRDIEIWGEIGSGSAVVIEWLYSNDRSFYRLIARGDDANSLAEIATAAWHEICRSSRWKVAKAERDFRFDQAKISDALIVSAAMKPSVAV